MIAHCWYTSHAVGNYLSCLSTGGWALHLSANLLLLTISHRIRTRIVAYRCISQRIAENFSRRGSGNHVVLVRREWGAPSRLLNESAIVDYLSKRGFCVIDISQCSLDQLPEARQRRFRRCVGRRVTLTSRTFSVPEGGTIVVLNPSNRVATTILDIGVFCGLHSGMFICEPAGEDGEHFTADVREVSQFIDVTLKHTNENRQQLIDFVEHVISLAPCTPPAMTI